MLEICDLPGHYMIFVKQGQQWAVVSETSGLSVLSGILNHKIRRLIDEPKTVAAFAEELTFYYSGSRGVLATTTFGLEVDEGWSGAVEGGAARLRKYCKPITTEFADDRIMLEHFK